MHIFHHVSMNQPMQSSVPTSHEPGYNTVQGKGRLKKLNTPLWTMLGIQLYLCAKRWLSDQQVKGPQGPERRTQVEIWRRNSEVNVRTNSREGRTHTTCFRKDRYWNFWYRSPETLNASKNYNNDLILLPLHLNGFLIFIRNRPHTVNTLCWAFHDLISGVYSFVLYFKCGTWFRSLP